MSVNFFSFTSLKLPALKEFLEHCFSKNYIKKDLQVIQDNIAKSCAHAVYGNDDIQKRLYFLSEILTPHQLVTYTFKVETKTYPLFDCLFWGQYIEEDDMRKFFELFDAAGFNYVATEHSLLVQAISKYDPFSMRELYKRGCRINQECEYTMHYNIQCHLHKMQYEIEYFRGSKKAIHYFLESVITTPDLLRKFFNPALLEDTEDPVKEENYRIMVEAHCEQYGINFKKAAYTDGSGKLMDYLNSPWERRQYVATEKQMNYMFETLEICIKEFGYDIKQQYIHDKSIDEYRDLYHNGPMTLLDSYLFGFRPIMAIYPEWHQKFLDLLTP